MATTKVKKQTSSSVDDMKLRGKKKKMSDDDQTQTVQSLILPLALGLFLKVSKGSSPPTIYPQEGTTAVISPACRTGQVIAPTNPSTRIGGPSEEGLQG
jgi:hypothetical protein